jgi:hypothetical protein
VTTMSTFSPAVEPVIPAHERDGIAIHGERPIGDSGQAEVAKEAYALFLERGGVHGHDVEDWLRAEQLVRQRRSNARDLGLADLDL